MSSYSESPSQKFQNGKHSLRISYWLISFDSVCQLLELLVLFVSSFNSINLWLDVGIADKMLISNFSSNNLLLSCRDSLCKYNLFGRVVNHIQQILLYCNYHFCSHT